MMVSRRGVRRRVRAHHLAERPGARNPERSAAGRAQPITLGPTEPFITTIKNPAYAALLLSLPVLLYQAYAFLVPAFSPKERRVALPLTLMVPVLFIAGVVFCFLVVLPPALDFLLSFNATEFNIQLRAKDYYTSPPSRWSQWASDSRYRWACSPSPGSGW